MIRLSRPRRISGRATFELTEFLVDVLGIGEVGARFDGKLTYHASCHLLRELGIDRQPRTLLDHVAGAESWR
jgi:L-lactate dehydrogenase complex protein LldE